MSIEIKVPSVGESINEVTLAKWVKADGEYAERDEVIAELESEKATFEINAEQAGVIKHLAQEGDTINIGAVVASIDTEAAKPAAAAGEQEEKSKPQAAPSKEMVTAPSRKKSLRNLPSPPKN